MRSATLLPLLALLACSSDPERLPPPKPGASSVASTGSGGEGGASATGGAGGASSSSSTGASPCDPFTDPGCCAQSQFCPEGSLGPCVVNVVLCGGECTGMPQPIPATHCGEAGTCVDGECVEPPQGGAGGVGGA